MTFSLVCALNDFTYRYLLELSDLKALTSQSSLEVDFGLSMEVFYAGWPAARQEDVLLLVPRGRVMNRPLALLI